MENETFTNEYYSSTMDQENLTENWFLLGSPVPIVTIISVYLLVVLKLGPWYMEDKKPMQVKNLMRLYNIAQVLYNGAMIYVFVTPFKDIAVPVLYLLRNSCTVPTQSIAEYSLRYLFLEMCWYCLILKVIDLFDTVFMVMRKKFSHVTFLHVYHHAATVFFVWFSIKYIKAHQGAFPAFINLNVHLVMYSYYFLATFDSFKKYLWWKRHITKLQLIQLVIIIAYLSSLYYYECPISSQFAYIWLFNVIVNFFLFTNFYVRTYILKPKDVNISKTK